MEIGSGAVREPGAKEK
jgi:hypothetical protein